MALKKYRCINLKMLLFYSGIDLVSGSFQKNQREAAVLSWAPSGKCICLNPHPVKEVNK